MAFTDAPRIMAQGAHVVVLSGAQNAAAKEQLVSVLQNYELLETQAKDIVDTAIWTNDIAPNL